MKKQRWVWGLAIAGLLAETLVPLPVWAIEPQTVQGELDGTEAKLNDGSFYDSYEMEGKAGESVAIALDSPAFDTYLLLLDPAGKTLVEQDDGEGSNVRLVVTLPQDGRYRIFATSSKPGDKGAYTLHWQPATPEDVARFQQKAEADRLFEQGNQDFNASQFQDALQAWQQALKHYRFLKDRKREGATLNNFGNSYNSMGQYQKAKEYYLQSLEISREIKNRKAEAASLDNLGTICLFLGDYPQAINYHEQSLAIEQELGNRKGEAISLGNIANVYDAMAEYQRAINYHEQGLKIAQEIGNKKGEASALGGLGNAYQSLGQYQRAIDYHSQSLAIKKEVGNRQGVAISLANLGNAYDSLGQYDRAINYHEQALQIARELHDRSGEMMSLSSIGQAYSALGQYQRAITAQEQSLIIAQEIGYRSAEASILVSLSNIYLSIGQYQRAISCDEKALIIVIQLGDRNGEARILGNLGIGYKSLGQYQKAIENYQQALLIQQQIGDLQGQAGSLGNLGNVSGLLGHHSTAIDYHEESLVIEHQIGNRRGEAGSLSSLGDAYYSLKQYPKAIDLYQQALAIEREIGDRKGEATSLNNLGKTYFEINRLPESETALRASLAVYEAIQRDVGQNDRDRVSLLETQQRAYLNLQRTLIALNKIPEALEVADRSRARSLLSFLREARPTSTSALKLPHNPLAYVKYPQKSQHLSWQVIDNDKTILATKFKNDDLHEEATRLIRLADENRELGKLELALNFLERALEIAHQTGNSETEIDVLSRMGSCYGGLGQFDRALSYFQQVLSLARKKGDRLNESAALNMSGWAYAALGKNETAIETLQQALKIRQELDDHLGQVATLSGLGWIYINQGLYERALDYFEPALVISQEIKNLPMEGLILNSLGNIKLGMNQTQEALRKFELALNVFRKTDDRLGEGLALRGLGMSFKELGQLDQAEISLKQAVEIHEKLQFELKKDTNKISILDQQMTTYLLLQNVLIDEHKTASALEVADRSRARSLMSFLAAAKDQTQTDLSAAEMQAVARQQNGTIVLYSAFETELYVWVVPPIGEIFFRRIPLDQDQIDLAKAAQDIRDSAITTGRGLSKVPISPSLRRGYDLLIKPIANLLATTPAAKVIIVPHRELALVPFAALQDEQGNFLIDRYRLSLTPSISVLANTSRQAHNATGQPLIIGNPSPMPNNLDALPASEIEARAIAQTLKATPLIGSQATETAIKSKIDQASLLHFATHGTIAQTAAGELDSWLALAPDGSEDGKLTIAEIFDRHLTARLAILSACDTGKGNVTGEGVIGLARAFLKAGVPTVVASLWKVPDEPTAMMMQAFYAERAAGKDAATALRSAMLTVRKTYPGPQNWAAFVAIGDTISPTP